MQRFIFKNFTLDKTNIKLYAFDAISYFLYSANGMENPCWNWTHVTWFSKLGEFVCVTLEIRYVQKRYSGRLRWLRRQQSTPIRDINISASLQRMPRMRGKQEVSKYTMCMRLYVHCKQRKRKRDGKTTPWYGQDGIYDKYDLSIDTIAVR